MDMKFNGTLHNTERSQTNESSSSQPIDVTRRRFLATSAVGLAGLGAVGSAAAAPDTHTLVIEGTGPATTYSFTVGGNLQKSTANGAGINSSDEIVGQSAHGVVTRGKDAYTFTGPLYSFNFDESNEIDVELDGEAARVGQRPDHTLVIEGTGPATSYSFSTSRGVEKSTAYGAGKNDSDKINPYGVAGFVSGGKDAYTFDGELQAFDFDRSNAIDVKLDGRPARVGERPDQAMTLFTEREYWDAEYEVTVSGTIREVVFEGQSGRKQSVGEKTISGWVWGGAADKFTYDGEIESFTTNDPDALEAYSNYEKLY